MPNDDPELSRPLLQRLAEEGVVIREGVTVKEVAGANGAIRLSIEEAGRSSEICGSHLFIPAGRKPRTEGLGLRAAGVDYNANGIIIDQHLQTTARGVYAAGDVIDGPRVTHVCIYHAGIVIKNALFRVPAKIDYRSLPWVTYTDPELAQVGMTEQQARERYGERVRIVRVPYSANDRARTERQSTGLLKVVSDRRGRVFGASIFGANAGELAGMGRNHRKKAKAARSGADHRTLSDVGRDQQSGGVGVLKAAAHTAANPGGRAHPVPVAMTRKAVANKHQSIKASCMLKRAWRAGVVAVANLHPERTGQRGDRCRPG